jgi:hypothetical protein
LPFDLRPHQEAAIAKMHNGCILCGGVGVGKTHTAIGYYLKNEAPKDVYVITTAKKRDKHDWQLLWGDVGMTGNPETTMGALVTVDSWENIKKYEEVENAFFVFDEQRLVGAGRWVKAFYKIAAANRWIMLSATPGDNWLDYVPVFRANGFIKNLTQFKEDHVVSRWTGRYYQVTGYRQVSRLVRWRNQLLVEMPYEMHTTRHHHEIAVEYDKDLVRELVKNRWHVYEGRPLTDASELFRVMRKVVYTDASRIAAVETLLLKHPKLIVFYNFDYELEILRNIRDPYSNSSPENDSTKTTSSPSTTPPEPSSTSTPSPPSLTEASTPNTPTSPSTRSQPSQQPGLPLEDPWSYLLSPEGMRANGQNPKSAPCAQSGGTRSTRSSGTSTQTYPSTPGTTYDFDTNQETTECRKNDHVSPYGETISKTSLPSSSVIGNGAGSTSLSTSGTLSSEKELTSFSNRPTMSSSPLTNHKIAPIADGVMTGSERPSEKKSTSDGAEKETEEWQTNQQSASPPTTPSRLSSAKNDTGTTSASSGRLEESPRTSSSTKQSISSRTHSPGRSMSGSGSTSQPRFQVAEWNGHKHEEVPTSTSWVYLVQYVAGAEAWECTDTDAMVFYSMPYSFKIWSQAHGRIDRLNTSFLDLHYYSLFGGSIIELGVAKSLKMKKSFNESAFGRALGFK